MATRGNTVSVNRASSWVSAPLALTLALASFAPLAKAANPKAADATRPKYGVVDMQAVILGVGEGKEARAALEKEIKSKEGDLQKQRSELEKLNEEWKKQAPLLSEDARSKKQQDFQEKFLALRNAEMQFQNDIKQKEQKATQKIAVKVAGMVEGMAKERDLDAVFETNSAGLLYLRNPTDLTQEVIKQYDSAQKGSKKPAKK